MKKYDLKIILITLIIITIVIITYILLLKSMNQLAPQRINMPGDYIQIFDAKVRPQIVHFFSEVYHNHDTYPVTYIEIDSLSIHVFKYKILNQTLSSTIHIQTTKFPQWYFIPFYYSLRLDKHNLEIFFRPNLTTQTHRINIISSSQIDTVLFDQNKIILKGIMDKLMIKFDKSSYNADQYIMDEFPENPSVKFYLAWINKDGYIYEILITTKKFNDEKILSLF